MNNLHIVRLLFDISFMYTTKQAIVLHLQKYNDKTSILHTYTQDAGRLQYIVHITKKNNLLAQLQPLSIIEIEANTPNTFSQLPHIKLVRLIQVPQDNDIRRLTISIFIAEILYKILRHPLPDSQLFDYIVQTIQDLNTSTAIENCHLQFMINLTDYLGIMPNIDAEAGWLDMQTGLTTSTKPAHKDVFDKDEIQLLNALSISTDVNISRTTRQQLLDKLCRYYELHLNDFYIPKSLDILKELFD